MEGLQGCQEQEGLSLQELYALEALPGAANQIDFAVLPCELEAGHTGPDLALGPMYGARARWLQWVPGERREWLDIAENEHCDAKGPPVSDIPGDVEWVPAASCASGRHPSRSGKRRHDDSRSRDRPGGA